MANRVLCTGQGRPPLTPNAGHNPHAVSSSHLPVIPFHAGCHGLTNIGHQQQLASSPTPSGLLLSIFDVPEDQTMHGTRRCSFIAKACADKDVVPNGCCTMYLKAFVFFLSSVHVPHQPIIEATVQALPWVHLPEMIVCDFCFHLQVKRLAPVADALMRPSDGGCCAKACSEGHFFWCDVNHVYIGETM